MNSKDISVTLCQTTMQLQNALRVCPSQNTSQYRGGLEFQAGFPLGTAPVGLPGGGRTDNDGGTDVGGNGGRRLCTDITQDNDTHQRRLFINCFTNH